MNGRKIIKWDEKAVTSFKENLDYVEGRWGFAAANSFGTQLLDIVEQLPDFPEMGRMENPEFGIRAFVFNKQITIFYKVNDKSINILKIHNNYQNQRF